MITTIPELDKFLAEKTKRLEEEDRIRRESAAARQLAAARALEQETAAVVNATEKLTATWSISLDTTCPHCDADVNLLDYADFWDSRLFAVPEHGTDRTKDVEVNCPECMMDFKVDLDY
jgi:hypothetical protein